MKTNYFYLDESGCYTTDIKKAKAIISKNGVTVKPKCFVDNNLRIVSNFEDAKAIINTYKDDMLQILLLESGGPTKFRHTIEEMSDHYARVLSYRTGCNIRPICPTNKICMLANFMEETPLITSCHTKTDLIDKDGKVKKSRTIKFAPFRTGQTDETGGKSHYTPDLLDPQIHSTIKRRSLRVVVSQKGRTLPYTESKKILHEDECIMFANSYPAALISLKDFEAINNGTDFLNTYLYFCE